MIVVTTQFSGDNAYSQFPHRKTSVVGVVKDQIETDKATDRGEALLNRYSMHLELGHEIPEFEILL